jgi:hypothetical protein
MACSEWKVPCLPVKPWQIILVSPFTQTLAEADMERADMARTCLEAARASIVETGGW